MVMVAMPMTFTLFKSSDSSSTHPYVRVHCLRWLEAENISPALDLDSTLTQHGHAHSTLYIHSALIIAMQLRLSLHFSLTCSPNM